MGIPKYESNLLQIFNFSDIKIKIHVEDILNYILKNLVMILKAFKNTRLILKLS